MDPVSRFEEYAAAFEKLVETGDGSVLEPYFTENAVVETTGAPAMVSKQEGRDAIIANFKQSVDALDRRVDSRKVTHEHREEDGKVISQFTFTLGLKDQPSATLRGVSTTTFEGDRISHMEDRLDPDAANEFGAWVAAHASKLSS